LFGYNTYVKRKREFRRYEFSCEYTIHHCERSEQHHLPARANITLYRRFTFHSLNQIKEAVRLGCFFFRRASCEARSALYERLPSVKGLIICDLRGGIVRLCHIQIPFPQPRQARNNVWCDEFFVLQTFCVYDIIIQKDLKRTLL